MLKTVLLLTTIMQLIVATALHLDVPGALEQTQPIKTQLGPKRICTPRLIVAPNVHIDTGSAPVQVELGGCEIDINQNPLQLMLNPEQASLTLTASNHKQIDSNHESITVNFGEVYSVFVEFHPLSYKQWIHELKRISAINHPITLGDLFAMIDSEEKWEHFRDADNIKNITLDLYPSNSGKVSVQNGGDKSSLRTNMYEPNKRQLIDEIISYVLTKDHLEYMIDKLQYKRVPVQGSTDHLIEMIFIHEDQKIKLSLILHGTLRDYSWIEYILKMHRLNRFSLHNLLEILQFGIVYSARYGLSDKEITQVSNDFEPGKRSLALELTNLRQYIDFRYNQDCALASFRYELAQGSTLCRPIFRLFISDLFFNITKQEFNTTQGNIHRYILGIEGPNAQFGQIWSSILITSQNGNLFSETEIRKQDLIDFLKKGKWRFSIAIARTGFGRIEDQMTLKDFITVKAMATDLVEFTFRRSQSNIIEDILREISATDKTDLTPLFDHLFKTLIIGENELRAAQFFVTPIVSQAG